MASRLVSRLAQRSSRAGPAKKTAEPSSWAPPPNPTQALYSRTSLYPQVRNPPSSPSGKLRFVRLDYDSAIGPMFKTAIPAYRSSFLTLRSIPASAIPASPPSPFPPMAAYEGETKTYTDRPVRFGIVTSKKAISTCAVERNRARTRLKDIVSTLVRRSEIPDLISPGMAYLAMPTGEFCYAPRDDVEQDVLKALIFLRSKRDVRPKNSGPRSFAGQLGYRAAR